jgi:hypothetical protein
VVFWVILTTLLILELVFNSLEIDLDLGEGLVVA